MTFHVNFNAEQTFLSFVKNSISRKPINDELELEISTMCILACAAALESTVNTLLKENTAIRYYDELRITSKIQTLADLGGITLDWSKAPFQDITRLIKIRNWLAHFKDSTIGLVGSEDGWIVDEINKLPSIDPQKEFRFNVIKKYYKSTREALKILAIAIKAEPYSYEFLDTEKYEHFLVG